MHVLRSGVGILTTVGLVLTAAALGSAGCERKRAGTTRAPAGAEDDFHIPAIVGSVGVAMRVSDDEAAFAMTAPWSVLGPPPEQAAAARELLAPTVEGWMGAEQL